MGWVYVLRAETDTFGWGKSLIKIGMSDRKDPMMRINEIAEEWWEERRLNIQVMGVQWHLNALDRETEYHREYWNSHIPKWDLAKHFGGECNGDTEWFVVKDSQIPNQNKTPWLGIAVIAFAALVVFAIATGRKPENKRIPTKTIVIAQRANVRSAPSINDNILCQVEPNEVLKTIGSDGMWDKVEACNGKSGYVHNKMISKSRSAKNR